MQLRPALEVAREVNDAAAVAEAAAVSKASSHGGGGGGSHRPKLTACGRSFSSCSSSSSPSSSSSASSSPASPPPNATAPQPPPPDQRKWVAEDALTVDPSASSSLERRFSCVRPGTAVVCRAPGLAGPNLDAFYPLSFVMRIAKAKAVSRCVALNLSDAVPVICFSYDTEIGSLRFVLASKDESKATDVDREVAAVAPKYVPDALSERVDEACRAKCNMAKRKRTRRVWSRREACAHAKQQQALLQQQQQQQQQAAQTQTSAQPVAGAKKRKRPSSSGGSERKRRKSDRHDRGHAAAAQPPPDVAMPPPALMPPQPTEASEAEAYAAAMSEVAGWAQDGGDASPRLVVVPASAVDATAIGVA